MRVTEREREKERKREKRGGSDRPPCPGEREREIESEGGREGRGGEGRDSSLEHHPFSRPTLNT